MWGIFYLSKHFSCIYSDLNQDVCENFSKIVPVTYLLASGQYNDKNVYNTDGLLFELRGPQGEYFRWELNMEFLQS